MENMDSESVVFIFDGASLDELMSLKEKVLLKHFQCHDHHDQILKHNLASQSVSNDLTKAPKDVFQTNQSKQKENILE